ncbi:hypothetical protein D3C75_917000 [compost metagenome]
MPSGSAATGGPSQDSVVCTTTPLVVGVMVHTWTPSMPCAGPPQTMRRIGSTSRMVETIGSPCVSHWKVLPNAIGPDNRAWETFFCQAGHWSMPVCNRHTVSCGASISIERSTMTWAFRSTSMVARWESSKRLAKMTPPIRTIISKRNIVKVFNLKYLFILFHLLFD